MKKGWLLIGILAVVIGCSEQENIPTLQVGDEFTDSNIRIISIDTFSVEMSTYRFDSIITSGTNRLLIGQYVDNVFGTIRSESYMELTSFNYDIPIDGELDSIALILNYDQYYYSDTTKISTIQVHTLTDELRPEEDDFYNTSTVPFKEDPEVVYNYFPRPTEKDSIHISLPISVGQVVFDKIRQGDINEDEELRNDFKGFALIPGETNDGAVIGFDTNNTETYLRFFYRIPGEFGDDEKTFDLTVNFNASFPTHFNRIQSNDQGTFFEALNDQEINLSALDADNRSYIQAGVGLVTRIQFPSIKNLFEIPGTGTIMDATLYIKPNVQEFRDLRPVRDSLSVHISDQNNNLVRELFDGRNFVKARINEDDREFDEIVYEIDVRPYLESELNERPEVDNALVLFPDNFNNTVDRTILEGALSNDFEATLIITYAIYDE